jgi:periplasmic protein TonB
MVPAPGPEDRQLSLNACLLEGDSAVEKRARRIKRRAIFVSIILQILVVGFLVLLPLLSRGEDIANRVIVYPRLPYKHGSNQPRPLTLLHAHPAPSINRFFQPPRIPDSVVTRDNQPQPSVDNSGSASEIDHYTIGSGGQGDFVSSTPPPSPAQAPARRSISEGVQQAMLIRRVEPSYPTLARQLRREGRVELHAIISTDGTVQALEVVSGDPLLIQSALGAVREWRYRPTFLNGQAVEIDTHITVIYTLH